VKRAAWHLVLEATTCAWSHLRKIPTFYRAQDWGHYSDGKSGRRGEATCLGTILEISPEIIQVIIQIVNLVVEEKLCIPMPALEPFL
jgi:hypothetical protein